MNKPTVESDAFGALWMDIECEYNGEPAVARVPVHSVSIKVKGKKKEKK